MHAELEVARLLINSMCGLSQCNNSQEFLWKQTGRYSPKIWKQTGRCIPKDTAMHAELEVALLFINSMCGLSQCNNRAGEGPAPGWDAVMEALQALEARHTEARKEVAALRGSLPRPRHCGSLKLRAAGARADASSCSCRDASDQLQHSVESES
ncbi:unnamed protein product, partial [Prorocentrum cordatum]